MAKVYSVGDVLGSRVEITEFLSVNGQGLAYQGQDLATGNTVFVKQLNADLSTTGGATSRRRFEREQSIRLDPRHNVQVLYGFEHLGALFMVSEWIDGTDLDEKLRRDGRPLSNDDTRDVLRQSVEGLSDAHNKGIWHRDVKPKNIMIDRAGTVKIVDYGICRIKGEATICDSGGPIGTLHFMSPEHVKNDGVDRQSDLFSLGGVAYYCVTLAVPFDGTTEVEIFRNILYADPVPPKDVNPAVDDDLNRIILRLLAKEKTARYRDAEHLIDDLEKGFRVAPSGPRCLCGATLIDGARRCARCGSSRHTPSTPYEGKIVVLNGKNKGTTIRIRPSTTEFGRYELSPEDDLISRRHAKIFFAEGLFWLEDIGSLNGTSVNSLHIPKGGRHPLVPGDRIRFADTFCEFAR